MPISNWNTGAVRSREAMRLLTDEIGADLDWSGVLIAHLDTGFTNHIVFNLASGTTRPCWPIAASTTWIPA